MVIKMNVSVGQTWTDSAVRHKFFHARKWEFDPGIRMKNPLSSDGWTFSKMLRGVAMCLYNECPELGLGPNP